MDGKTDRDRRTGRFVHVWGYIGSSDQGDVSECQDCGKVRLGDSTRYFPDREAVRNRPGVQFLEGY